MIENVKLIIGMCFFGTSYVSLDVQDEFVKFFISLLAGFLSLFLMYKVKEIWQQQQNSQTAQTHSQEQNYEN